jgi:hypothetical protein
VATGQALALKSCNAAMAAEGKHENKAGQPPLLGAQAANAQVLQLGSPSFYSAACIMLWPVTTQLLPSLVAWGWEPVVAWFLACTLLGIVIHVGVNGPGFLAVTLAQPPS